MNLASLLKDFGLPWASPGERHYRDGWVNMPCPFCFGSGNPGNHLGFCTDRNSSFYGRFICWRCGPHPTLRTLSIILKVPIGSVRKILTTHLGRGVDLPVKIRQRLDFDDPGKDVSLPTGTKPLLKVAGACRYLESRGFDPAALASMWDVQATGPAGMVVYGPENRKLNLAYRLVVPIYWHGKLVSWQTRDWTGKARIKYLTAPPELEAKHHKSILYSADLAIGGRAVLVEGVTDVWAVGPGAVACFGIKYRPEQVKELADRWPEVWMLFDGEPRAQLQALRVARDLEERGVHVIMKTLPAGLDPASVSGDKLRALLV